jgi:phosphatidylserine/phosphatidylglycerophosphate/cardiolipin synthase-like enzyme
MMPGRRYLNLDTQIGILTKDIPKRFVDLLIKSQPIAVYICSPWISEFSESSMNFVEILAQKGASVRVFTRPSKKPEVRNLLIRLRKQAKAQIFTSRYLHAKIYVIEGKRDKYVILGSANFTEEARGNIEMALLVSDNDLFMKRVIYSLLSYLRPLCERWR